CRRRRPGGDDIASDRIHGWFPPLAHREIARTILYWIVPPLPEPRGVELSRAALSVQRREAAPDATESFAAVRILFRRVATAFCLPPPDLAASWFPATISSSLDMIDV